MIYGIFCFIFRESIDPGHAYAGLFQREVKEMGEGFMKRVLITFCLCTLVLTACSAQQVIKTPTIIRITEVELRDINRNDATVRVGALFHNPNAVGYTLENITFSTFIDGQPLGTSQMQGALNVNANEDFEVWFDTKLLLDSLPMLLLSVFSRPAVDVEVKGQATLVTDIRKFTFSFNPKSKVEVKND
jgi:hypothetical protein